MLLRIMKHEHLVLVFTNLQIQPFVKLHVFLPHSLPGRMEFYIITFLCKNNNELLVIWAFHHSLVSSIDLEIISQLMILPVKSQGMFISLSFKKISQRRNYVSFWCLFVFFSTAVEFRSSFNVEPVKSEHHLSYCG